ncbi:HAMP domain-containing methyl-accepting chemotaxis protein [Paractinoplanes hotanensis]|uniref:Methyl-accepting chemotaxis protein n=1 Tax=Paractinoplanes hotanensis TaxID=2906497 RepID=A0ABT0Y8I6_9ACTN|nr:methyl-accepting chemotaxis protein [Actinoplanes hotanensis]MCM4082348.1 methyl-accepting chemotaxis protein [Actinoplanes hotanensis]
MKKARSTFSTRLVGGFALVVGLAVLMGTVGVIALAAVTNSKDDVIASATLRLSYSEQLSTLTDQRIADHRAYLLTGSPEDLTAIARDRDQMLEKVARLRELLTDPVELELSAKVSQAEQVYTAALDPTVEQRKSLTSLRNLSQLNAGAVGPAREALQKAIADLLARTQADVEQSRAASSRTAVNAIVVVCVLGGISIASAVVISARLRRGLRREIGAAVAHIQSSSAQLEAAATQQASGGRDQAGAMNDITATISELLITSRRIADNAQRVSEIAGETAEAARNGDATIEQTRASIYAIRTQVDQIVGHMLALGEKSQQIGAVVDLVAELAEQTNILAINATIEASDAGEWGRRFTVVAEDIRKLADRTAGSAKQIRTLIEDVRGAVTTTVTTTEAGANAVDSGVRKFGDATSSFRRIAGLVTTAGDASREIELSTKQQTSAVEQVNVAASDTARVSHETEVSALQTKQTAAHLSLLSSDLQKLIGADH